ncbi:MAG: recombinase family protein [Oscillospiraceae bacterium]|jgi:site-specific DNA recombinase|nr:recombinase family protein [Oscillospiraceae bacterium]
MKTGIYVRVSTEEQAQEGFSIRAQQQKLVDYTRIKDWTVYKVYSDEGISGKNITDRPAVKELIEDIESGKIENVLVFKIDRLTRSTKDLINLLELFNEHDCCFNSLMESIDTQTPSGRMFLKIIGIFAEFERENIIERSRLGFERKAREGYSLATRTASFGYDKEPKKIQQINKYEAQIVLEVFDMFANKNMSFLEIAQNLNERGVPTKEKGSWHSRSIKNMLTNCNYIGNVRYATKDPKRNFETDGKHEAIVPIELFEETQDLIAKISVKSYTKRPKDENYYSGILICDKCDGKLVSRGDYQTKGGEKYWVNGYRCSNYLRKTCSSSTMLHKNVDIAFLAYINNIADFDVSVEMKVEQKENMQKQALEAIETLNKQDKKLSTKENEILDLYINGSLDFVKYINIKTSIDKEKERILLEIERLETKEDEKIEIIKTDIINNLKANWELLNNAEKRQFMIKFVDTIRIVNEVEKGKSQGVIKITDISFSSNAPNIDKRKNIKNTLGR